MGLFGDFKYSCKNQENNHAPAETVWVSKRYDPNDGRDSAPVARYKTVSHPITDLSTLPSEWQPIKEPSRVDINRRKDESDTFPSLRSTRCEDWSTLREMLPSKGVPRRIEHPRWGTGLGPAPEMGSEPPRRHPIINSAMTRFADDMHLTHKEFKMF